MKLKDVLEKTTNFFRDKKSSSPRLDAELLLAHGLGVDRIRLYLDFDRPLTDPELEKCRELVRRRGTGEPVAYILGHKDFFALTLEVGPGVLIPRPETEHVVESVIEQAKKSKWQAPRIVDLGTGTGAIGFALLKQFPESRLLAMDMSEVALGFARRNAEKLKLSDRVTFLLGDASLAGTRDQAVKQADFGQVDILVANPPYIAADDSRVETNVKKFEPSEALYAADNGLADLKSWTSNWRAALSENSFVACEMGTDQGPALISWFNELKLNEVQVKKDLAGHDRVIQGVHHG